jgi:hypothetical protein
MTGPNGKRAVRALRILVGRCDEKTYRSLSGCSIIIAATDPVSIRCDAAALRLQALEGVPILALSPEARVLAERLVTQGPLPDKATVDALHISVSVVNGMDYLLTWNCTHIANAAMRHRIEEVCRSLGYEPPVICTPEELMGE